VTRKMVNQNHRNKRVKSMVQGTRKCERGIKKKQEACSSETSVSAPGRLQSDKSPSRKPANSQAVVCVCLCYNTGNITCTSQL